MDINQARFSEPLWLQGKGPYSRQGRSQGRADTQWKRGTFVPSYAESNSQRPHNHRRRDADAHLQIAHPCKRPLKRAKGDEWQSGVRRTDDQEQTISELLALRNYSNSSESSQTEKVAFRMLQDIILSPTIGIPLADLKKLGEELRNLPFRHDHETYVNISDVPRALQDSLSNASRGRSNSFKGVVNNRDRTAIEKYVEHVELWWENRGWYGSDNHTPHGGGENPLALHTGRIWAYGLGGGNCGNQRTENEREANS